MPGKKGYEHHCEEEKVEKEKYKKSIFQSPFSYAQIAMIWDFYVTNVIQKKEDVKKTKNGETDNNDNKSDKRNLVDYGWNSNTNKTDGSGAVEDKIFSKEYFDSLCFIRAYNCKDTLSAMNLSHSQICATHPRAVLLQNFKIGIDENEKIKLGHSESKLNAFFRHIRNAFAHDNTYFFDNGMMLLEDKDKGKNTITAAILIKQKTLLDWIKIIDKNEKFYHLVDVCAQCNKGE